MINMIYYDLTGEINGNSAQGLIHHFNTQIIDNNYNETLTIFLSSQGGDIDSAIRIYDFLKSVENKVFVIGFGQIDSAAIIIYLAGDKRVVLPKTRFRFHEPTYNMQQESSSLSVFDERVKLFKELDNRMKEIAVSETGKGKAMILKLYSDGVVLNTSQAKDFGLVHEIVKQMPKPQNI